MKSGSLNLMEPSGPVQAYTGIALPLPFLLTQTKQILGQNVVLQDLISNSFIIHSLDDMPVHTAILV
jgi:hypothetical protein